MYLERIITYDKPYQVDTDAARRLLNTRRRMYETVDKLRNPKIRGNEGGSWLANDSCMMWEWVGSGR